MLEKFFLLILLPLIYNSPKLHPEFELWMNLKYLNEDRSCFLNVIVFHPLSIFVSKVLISFHVILSVDPWNLAPFK